MNIIPKPYFLLLAFALIIISCNDNTSSKKTSYGSYELRAPNFGDTVNLIDANGLKQGKWVPTRENKLKDTLYYRNDTLVSKCVMDTFALAGTYKGKNIFCKSAPKDSMALRTILLNDKVIAEAVGSGLFEVPLSSLKVGQKFVVKIISCKKQKSDMRILNLDDFDKITLPKKEMKAVGSGNS